MEYVLSVLSVCSLSYTDSLLKIGSVLVGRHRIYSNTEVGSPSGLRKLDEHICQIFNPLLLFSKSGGGATNCNKLVFSCKVPDKLIHLQNYFHSD